MRPDVLPAAATEFIGGPAGRHVDPGGWWRRTSLWLIGLVSIPMALAVVQREHCVRFGWYRSDQFWRACFSDLPAQYDLGGLGTGLLGFVQGRAVVEQPVFAGTTMSLLGGFVPDVVGVDQQRLYFGYWVALVTLLLAVTVWCTTLLVPDDLQAAAQVALSPVIVLAAVLSSDALAVALVAAAMLAWKRDKPALAGVLLGFGALTRSYVVVVVVALLFVAVRTDEVARARRVLTAALGSAAAYVVVFLAAQPGTVTAAYTSWWGAKASYGSPWLLPTIAGFELPTLVVTALAALGVGLALALGWLFVRDAHRAPTWAQVALVVVALVMMTGKAVPVQASLWLLPLAAAAGVRWRDHLIWAAGEGAHFIAVWLYVGALTRADRALPGPWYAVFLVIRLAAITWLVWRVWEASQTPTRRVYAQPGDVPAAAVPEPDTADRGTADPEDFPVAPRV